MQKWTSGLRALLLPVFEQFTDGWDTADLKTAERLLATLTYRDRWTRSAVKAAECHLLAPFGSGGPDA